MITHLLALLVGFVAGALVMRKHKAKADTLDPAMTTKALTHVLGFLVQLVLLLAVVWLAKRGHYPMLAKPDPLVVRSQVAHSADTNRDFQISLMELTRVIELYNYRSGSIRTGQYRLKAGSEDGFEPGPSL